MPQERMVSVDLEDGGTLVVVAERHGPEMVSNNAIIAKLSGVTDAIEKVSRNVLAAVKAASPSAATVELGFGLAVEAGQLVALFGKGSGEASIKVTLEWSKAGSEVI